MAMGPVERSTFVPKMDVWIQGFQQLQKQSFH